MEKEILDIIRNNIDIHYEDNETQFVECSLYINQLASKMLELFVKSIKEELQKFAVKYYPCFNREQQREIAYKCGWSHEQLEQEFYCHKKEATCEFCGNKFEYDHADLLFEPKNLEEMKKKYGDSFPPLSEYRKIGVAYCPHCKKLNIVWRESRNE